MVSARPYARSLFLRFFANNTGWTLPALFSILRDLRDLAFDVSLTDQLLWRPLNWREGRLGSCVSWSGGHCEHGGGSAHHQQGFLPLCD